MQQLGREAACRGRFGRTRARARRRGAPGVIECDFQLSEEVDPAECLERLRGDLFLPGSGMQGARVMDDDGGAEQIASSELFQRLNGPLFKWS
jgi:hypothetical protein